jgi:hypothetical protein
MTARPSKTAINFAGFAGLRGPSGGQKPSPRGCGNASAWSAYATFDGSMVVTLF